MGVDHLFARRPGKHREAPILRGDKRERVVLIVNKLRRRQVSRAAMLCWLHDDADVTDNRLRDYPLVYERRSFRTCNLGTEGQHFVLIVHDGGAINRRESAGRIDGAA